MGVRSCVENLISLLWSQCCRPCLNYGPVTTSVRWEMTTKKRHALEEASLKWAKPLIEQSLAPPQEGSVEKKEPHMLHVVYRIKTVRGRPWWEKELIEKLQLDGPVIKCLNKNHSFMQRRVLPSFGRVKTVVDG